ncbi:hypothetical protein [Nocardioides sp. GCM10030258]|uniref:hypothetical protein n=1 Tax=unclassified Nocardioides TaxID=2615069 RepID=UPI0036246211
MLDLPDHDAASVNEWNTSRFQQFVAHRAVEAFDEPVLLRAGLRDLDRQHALFVGEPVHQARSDELSAGVGAGHLRPAVASKRRSNERRTSAAPIEYPTWKPKQIRVNSSITFNTRSPVPRTVRKLMKS